MSDKVIVNINGKEYSVSGNYSRDRVIAAAGEVDNVMRKIEETFGNKMSSVDVAVLAALNIADGIADVQKQIEEVKITNEKLEGDTQHYAKLWDEAKKTYMDSKEETTAVMKERDQLIRQLTEKEAEIDKMIEKRGTFETEVKQDAVQQLTEAQEKYKDLENNFFELQMGSIKLKSEYERILKENEELKKRVETLQDRLGL